MLSRLRDHRPRRRPPHDQPPHARPPRSRSSRLLAIGVLVVLVALALPLSTSAARLVLKGGPAPASTVNTRCTTSALTVSPVGTTPTTKQVQVTGLTAMTGETCVRGDVLVYSTSAPTTPVYTGTGAAAASFVTTGTAFTPPIGSRGLVYVTIDGWPVPATWVNPVQGGCAAPARASYAGAVLSAPGASDCEVTSLSTTNLFRLQYTATVTIKNKTAAPLAWTLGLDVHRAPFGTWTPAGFSNLGATGNGATSDDACGTNPQVLLRGKGTAVTIPANGTVSFTFTVHSTQLVADLTCD